MCSQAFPPVVNHIFVDVTGQKVRVIGAGGAILWTAAVSTSRYGLGEVEGSNCTPRGRHSVIEKIGAGQPLGSVFKSRVPTGEVWTPDSPLSEDDLILTRILWLAGKEPSNANSQQRYIYFHGTNHESKIGSPDSHGCIRLSNADMITLFDFAEVGTPVVIS